MIEKPADLKEARTQLANTLESLILIKTKEANEIERQFSVDLLSSSRFVIPRGRVSLRIANLQDEVLGFVSVGENYKGLREDPLFMKFAKNMCIVGARFSGFEVSDLKSNPQKTETFIKHLVAHYQLIREAGVWPSFIKNAHFLSVFEVGRILTEAKSIFGSDTDSRTVLNTAVSQVFNKRYPSIAEAKQAYDKALTESHSVFGSDILSEKLVRTAAGLVFIKRYPSIAKAKQE